MTHICVERLLTAGMRVILHDCSSSPLAGLSQTEHWTAFQSAAEANVIPLVIQEKAQKGGLIFLNGVFVVLFPYKAHVSG